MPRRKNVAPKPEEAEGMCIHGMAGGCPSCHSFTAELTAGFPYLTAFRPRAATASEQILIAKATGKGRWLAVAQAGTD